MKKDNHLPREHPHADAFLGAQQANAGSSVWRDDGRIAQWLFKACICGEDTPVLRTRKDAWVGVRVCKACGTKWEIQLGGEFGACGAIMTEPLRLWLHRQRYSWARWRWLRAEPGRQIRFNPDARRHRDAVTPTLDDLSLPSWPLYFWLRSVEWVQNPGESIRRFLAYSRQFLAPFRILTILHSEALGKGQIRRDGGWWLAVRDEPDAAIRTVRVHLISGQWDLHIEDPAEAANTAPWPPVSYVAGDDMLELVGRTAGLRNRREARDWLQGHGYSAPERIGLQRRHGERSTNQEAH